MKRPIPESYSRTRGGSGQWDRCLHRRSLLIRPGRCGAAGCAVGGLAAGGDGLVGGVGVDGEVLAVLVVVVEPGQVVELGAGAGRDHLAGEGVVAGEGDGGRAGGAADFGAG